jgi:hypothetical protein
VATHPMERFDPLLRELARFGLIAREGTESEHSWILSAQAQERLDELLANGGEPVLPEKLVYLSRLCAECHTRALTRLREGRYLCEACVSKLPAPQAVPAPSATAS